MTNETTTTTTTRDKYVVKVQKLLAKAEAAGTEEEADAFFAKVTQLMAAWEIDDSELRNRGEAGTSDEVTDSYISIGSYTPKADAVAMNQILKALNMRGGFKPYASGSPAYMHVIARASDLERFTLLWSSLQLQLVRQMKKVEPAGADRGALRTFRQSYKIAFCQAAAHKIKDIRKEYGAALVFVDAETAARADAQFGAAKRSNIRKSYAGTAAGTAAGNNADIGSSARVGGKNQKALGA